MGGRKDVGPQSCTHVRRKEEGKRACWRAKPARGEMRAKRSGEDPRDAPIPGRMVDSGVPHAAVQQADGGASPTLRLISVLDDRSGGLPGGDRGGGLPGGDRGGGHAGGASTWLLMRRGDVAHQQGRHSERSERRRSATARLGPRPPASAFLLRFAVARAIVVARVVRLGDGGAGRRRRGAHGPAVDAAAGPFADEVCHEPCHVLVRRQEEPHLCLGPHGLWAQQPRQQGVRPVALGGRVGAARPPSAQRDGRPVVRSTGNQRCIVTAQWPANANEAVRYACGEANAQLYNLAAQIRIIQPRTRFYRRSRPGQSTCCPPRELECRGTHAGATARRGARRQLQASIRPGWAGAAGGCRRGHPRQA